MTIPEFLELTNPDEYDFSDDMADAAYKSLKDAMEKFYVYFAAQGRATIKRAEDNFMNDYREDCENTVKQYGAVEDPDSKSQLLQDIYRKLWDKKNLAACSKGEKICGETMNTVNTTLAEWYVYLETEEQKKEREELKDPKQKISNKYILSRYFKDKEGMKNLLGKKCQLFLSMYHTLGNFIPVPADCNAPRGCGVLKDYWDVTLKVIYDYYYEGKDHISDITGEKKELAERYREWLDSFKGKNANGQEDWDCFVEKNYMQDFVECGSEGGYGMPKELWRNHFTLYVLCKDYVKPINRGQIQEFFMNASTLIVLRSRRMIRELQKEDIMI